MHTKTITILCINDFHGEILQTRHTPGCARLSTLVKKRQQENPHTVVVFGGDNFRGEPVTEQLSGEPVTFFMRSLGAKVSAVGNHEFDAGMEMLGKWSKQGDFTFVAANVLDRRTGKVADGFKPYEILEVAGVKIAFIGLSTTEPLDRPAYPPDIRSLHIVNGTREARKWVTYLNNGEDSRGKPDVILALTHYGLKYAADGNSLVGEEVIDLCHQVPQISGVFTAHWHQFMSVHINRVPVVQGGSGGKGFAVLTVQLSPENRLLQVTPGFLDYSDRIGDIPPDKAMQRQIDKYKRRAMVQLGAVVGRIEKEIIHKSPDTAEVDMEGTPLTRLAVEVMRKETGCPIALMYSGRMGFGLPAGALTLYHLQKQFMFNDEIITMKLKGADLVQNLENGICTLRGERASPVAIGGLRVVADYQKPFGSRIESVMLENGQPLDPDRVYDIAVDAFMAANEMGYDFSSGTDRHPTGVFLRDSMIRAIRESGGIPAVYPGNVTVKNKPSPHKEAECR